MPKKVLFLTLKVFSATGGIEKVCRVAGKALHEIGEEEGYDLSVWSMHDKPGDCDERYIPAAVFRGFGGSRALFTALALKAGRCADLVILSHINLLGIGYAIKKFIPSIRLVLITHGIEVWEPLPSWKQKALRACDLLLPVSRFTKEKMLPLHRLKEEKLQVINNCLDPFLQKPTVPGKRPDLLQRYGLTEENKILFTLSRLSSAERYKGYDEVVMALKALRKEDKAYKYLIVGKWDEVEKLRLDRLVKQQGLQDSVIFAGFVPDSELADHFTLADLYVMPSRGEGFGIVFIEALYYGLPVIAGNRDGSADAVAGGSRGTLVDPCNTKRIQSAIWTTLRHPEKFKSDAAEVWARFSFGQYKRALQKVLFGAAQGGEKNRIVKKVKPQTAYDR